MSFTKCVVLEFSNDILNVGFCGEHVPRFSVPSNVLSCESEYVVTELLRKIFLDILLIKSKDYSVLLIENAFTKTRTRDQLTNILFHNFQVII